MCLLEKMWFENVRQQSNCHSAYNSSENRFKNGRSSKNRHWSPPDFSKEKTPSWMFSLTSWTASLQKFNGSHCSIVNAALFLWNLNFETVMSDTWPLQAVNLCFSVHPMQHSYTWSDGLASPLRRPFFCFMARVHCDREKTRQFRWAFCRCLCTKSLLFSSVSILNAIIAVLRLARMPLHLQLYPSNISHNCKESQSIFVSPIPIWFS